MIFLPHYMWAETMYGLHEVHLIPHGTHENVWKARILRFYVWNDVEFR